MKYINNLEINSIYDFDNALSINELLCKFWEKIEEVINVSNECIDILNWIKEEGLPDELQVLINQLVADGTIEQMINVDKIEELRTLINSRYTEISSQMEKNKKMLFQYVNILEYGAKLDGVTDDSEALEKALNDGCVSLPSNCEIFIGKTVHINKKNRILDGNGCTLYTNANTTAFEISQKYCTELIHNIDIKNFFVVMSRGGNFCTCYNTYFVNFTDLRLTGMVDGSFGIKIYNGFNITFKNVHINGTKGIINSPSGNNTMGIHILLSSDGINPSLNGVINATNILIDGCLIQKVKYGILQEVVDGTFDTNKINNVGFSDCDFPIFQRGGNESRFLNLQVSTIRAEYCGTTITNIGHTSVNNLYTYNTSFLINNIIDNACISFKGTINQWCPNKEGCCVLYDNKGIIDFSKADSFNYTPNVNHKLDNGNFGVIYPLKTTHRKRNNGLQTITLNPFYIEIINQTGYIDLKNNDGNLVNGSEFYMISSNNVDVDLPDGTIFRFKDTPNTMLHFMVVDNKLTILNQSPIYISNDITGNITGISANNKIHFMNAKVNINQFNFNKMGICILYSTTEGVTLSNGNNNILNYGNLNSNNAVSLYNNPLIMIPLNDGTGKGLAIKC